MCRDAGCACPYARGVPEPLPAAPADVPSRQAARELVRRHEALVSSARGILDHLDGTVVAVAAWVADDERRRVRAELALVPVERLGETTDRNLRLAAVQAAGYATAEDLLGVGPQELDALPGVGPTTAKAVVAAVDQLAGAAATLRPLRVEVDRAGLPTPEGADRLLALLHRLLRLRPLVEPHRTALTDYARTAGAALAPARRAASALRLAFSLPRARREARAALASLAAWEPWLAAADLPRVLADLQAAVERPDPGPFDLARDFLARPAEYYTALEDVVPQAATALAARGLLPADLVERVEARPLDLSAMTVALRGYQQFGARFALNQGRALLGDEMGLGKTVQALAVMSDLAAAGERRFLVVCPASLLATWAREVGARTTLTAHRLHGPGRDAAARAWRADGGVAVTSYEGLAHVPVDVPDVGLLVVDEAHYVKNPATRRARAVAAWAQRVWRVLMLTGTPMDNRLEDFLALVRVLQPELVDRLPRSLAVLGPDGFRRAVAPVYLRRNQADVLVELPGVLAADDWVEPTADDAEHYRAAVAAGNLMAMRRAAWAAGAAGPRRCAKLARLLEIVDAARAEGRATVVFSYFKDVLDVAGRALGERGVPVHGPLSGDVPVAERAALVDAYTADAGAPVLLAQVTVGGTGLNLQAASVVVLCEPQLTPAAEEQAVARLHRMGQARTVRAHRLLAEDTVDERMVELLAGKREVFDAYVRASSVAAATAAVDVTTPGLAREVVAAEQARLGYGPWWDEVEADVAAPGGAATGLGEVGLEEDGERATGIEPA